MEIVINKCYGGFSLSEKAHEKLVGRKMRPINDWELDRNDSDLVAIVKELGTAANTDSSELKVVEIPDGVEWEVAEYDGLEWIAEKHRTWA